jgi:hypothetical protein
MPRFVARSRCECQARLAAEVDEQGRVTNGVAIRDGNRESAPAHAIGEGERFDIGWLCPFCNRNTLRSFYRGALRSTGS